MADNEKINALLEEIRANQIEIARLRKLIEADKDELYAEIRSSARLVIEEPPIDPLDTPAFGLRPVDPAA